MRDLQMLGLRKLAYGAPRCGTERFSRMVRASCSSAAIDSLDAEKRSRYSPGRRDRAWGLQFHRYGQRQRR